MMRWLTVILALSAVGALGYGAELASAPGYPQPHPDALIAPNVIADPGSEYSDDFRAYQGVPTIERTPGGRLWAAWFGGGQGEDKNNYIMLVTSADDGSNWSRLKMVIDPDPVGPMADFNSKTWPPNHRIGIDPMESGPRRVFDPCLWRDPSGRLWLFFAQEMRRKEDGNLRPVVLWATVAENPEDENSAWSAPRAIAVGNMLNKPTVLSSGEWLLPTAYWQGDPSAGVVVSRDSGKTFEYLGGAGIFPERGRNCDEHMIVERRDGTLVMFVRGRFKKIMESVSVDRGKTWTPMKQEDAGQWPLAHANSRFFIRRLKSGRLLLIKHGEIAEMVSPRAKLMAFLSEDDGRTWKGGLLIDERLMVSYPDAVEGSDGSIYVIYDHERRANHENGKTIYLARVSEADILHGKASPGSGLRIPINQAKGINLLEYNLSKNADGDDVTEELKKNGWAELEPLNGQVGVLKNAVKLFSDKDDAALQIPPELLGRNYICAPQAMVRFRVVKSGLVFVMTPLPKRDNRRFIPGLNPVVQPFSQSEFLGKSGFRKVNFPETILMLPGPDNVISTYYKKMSAGEVFEIGAWGLVVF
jgi:hypothetical protein